MRLRLLYSPRRILAVIAFLLIATSAGAQNQVAVGVDASVRDDVTPAAGAVPWVSGAFSLYGYPTDALSWFVDGAGRGEYRSRSQDGAFTATALASGSYRRGLGTIGAELDGTLNLSTGGDGAALDSGVTLFGSTGSAEYAVYGEAGGGLSYQNPDTTYEVSGLVGGSVTIGGTVAPDLSVRGVYRTLADGNRQGGVGADLSVPWYPPHPFTATFGVGAFRSLGDTTYEVDDSAYYPDRFWDFSWNGEVAFSLSRRVALEVLVPGSLQLFTDHGPVVDGTMQSGRERVLSFAPAVNAAFTVTPRLTMESEIGGDLNWSNSPYQDVLSGYVTLAARYGF